MVGGLRYLTLGVAILLGVAIGFVAGRSKERSPPRPPATEATASEAPVITVPVAGMLAQAREVAALKQEVFEHLRREGGVAVPRASAPLAAPESAPDGGAPQPAGSLPLTPANLEADRRAADLVRQAETTRSWTTRDRVELRLLVGQMDRAARDQTLSRLAQGINAQQIIPDGPPRP